MMAVGEGESNGSVMAVEVVEGENNRNVMAVEGGGGEGKTIEIG